MRGAWRWAGVCGKIFLLANIGSANPLVGLDRDNWVSLDSTATDQTTDVATGAGGSMVYISGYTLAAPAGADGSQSIEARVMAYNSSGVRQWVAEYGSSGEDLANSVAADGTGVYVAGTESIPRNSSSSGADDDQGLDTDAFVVKYNSTGGVLWKTSWGTSEPDLGNGVAVDGESGLVYVVGTTRGLMPPSGHDDRDGRAGDGAGGGGGGGGVSATASAATSPPAGQDSTVGVQAGMTDVFLTCLGAADGEIQWTRQFGSSSADVGNRVAVGPRGGIFLVGQLGNDDDPSLAGPRAFLAKYDYFGNAQFTARLNSSSGHYAVDLAPSVGSGGEGVVYMSGYTLGDSPSVFLARFEGSTGTQTWLSHLGEESGTPHLAQSVAVVEGSQYGFSAPERGGEGGESGGSDAGAGTPVVAGEEAAGEDARVVVVGYNTSVASAGSHSSTGFTATADTNGNWAWYSASQKADRQTAIAIGGGGGRAAGQQQPGYGSESYAYVVGTVAASEASPGNYLFLDIQRVVRERSPTPAPTVRSAQQAASSPELVADPAGGASSTTGLSQGSSLWLLIIAPIFVVLSCIMTVGYVSKQCAIAFGTTQNQHHSSSGDGGGPVDTIEFSAGADGRGPRSTRSFRRGKEASSRWSDGASASPSNRSTDRRRRRDSGSGSVGGGSGSRSTGGGLAAAWPRSVAAVFRDRSSEGPPYRKLAARERPHDTRGEEDVRGRRRSSTPSSPLSMENGEVELRRVAAQQLHAPFDCPRGERSPSGGGGGGGSGYVRDTLAGPEDISHIKSAAAGWDAFEDEEVVGGAGGAGGEEGRSHMTGNPHGDEPAAGILLRPDEPPFGASPAAHPQELL